MPQRRHDQAWSTIRVTLLALSCLLGAGLPATAENGSTTRSTELIGDQALAFQGGYIMPSEQVSGNVAGARGGFRSKTLYAGGDALSVRFTSEEGFKPGDQVTLYRPTEPVYHPVTGAFLGRIVKILGVLEITTPPTNQVSEARILRSFDSISPGDPVMPYKPTPPVPDQGTSDGPLSGMIVAFKDPRTLTAQGDVVYIDRGAEDGVTLGDHFNVSRPDELKSMATPGQALAEVKVIGLQPRTATVRVTKSTDHLRRGDVVSRRPPEVKSVVPPGEKATMAENGRPVEGRVVDGTAKDGTPPMAAKAEPKEVEPPQPPQIPKREVPDIFFAFDKWDLSDKDKKGLAETAEFLKEYPTAKLLIEGHTDERGSHEYNLILGEKRAKEVQQFLTGLGLKNPMNVVSIGKERPTCTEQNESCRSKNRRVHLAINGG